MSNQTPADRIYQINQWVLNQGLQVAGFFDITQSRFTLRLAAGERQASIVFDGSDYEVTLMDRGCAVETGIAWDDIGRAKVVEYLRKPNPVDALTKISAMWADNARDAAGSAVDAVWPKDEVIDVTTQEQANELGVGETFAEVAKRPQETP